MAILTCWPAFIYNIAVCYVTSSLPPTNVPKCNMFNNDNFFIAFKTKVPAF